MHTVTWDVAEGQRPECCYGDDTIEIPHRDVFPLLVPITGRHVAADLEPVEQRVCGRGTHVLG